MHEITVVRRTDTGHRVVGHTGKCRFLHGHTYEFEVTLRSEELIEPGFVMDFGAIKTIIDQWDHKLLLWTMDSLLDAPPYDPFWKEAGVLVVPFNPTAENMAEYLAKSFYDHEDHITYANVIVRETESTVAEFEVGV